jgi:hypothetical protein
MQILRRQAITNCSVLNLSASTTFIGKASNLLRMASFAMTVPQSHVFSSTGVLEVTTHREFAFCAEPSEKPEACLLRWNFFVVLVSVQSLVVDVFDRTPTTKSFAHMEGLRCDPLIMML